MTTQPEALRLADELDVGDFDVLTNYTAAAELRRLQEANQELLNIVKKAAKTTRDPDTTDLLDSAIAKHGGQA